MPAATTIGKNVPRKEAESKLTGRSIYVDDMVVPHMIFGTTVRSPVARGILKKVHFGGPIPWAEFTIVTARDIPGKNVVKFILEDQPCLVEKFINHVEEPVVLLAHPDRYLLEEARRHVRLEIEELTPLFDLEDSLAGTQVIWGTDNTFKKIDIEKGDVDAVWAHAAHIIEGTYRTGASEQLYIENNGMVAECLEDGSVVVWGSMQCPYYVLPAVCHLMDLSSDQVRIVQMETGGGFGGKEDYPSMIACHATLLARKSGKPVKLVYDREEDMAVTTKRHPSRTRHRTAVDAEGKLLAMDVDFAIDGGAYATLSAVVLSRGAIHASGPYFCPNVRVRARAVATNYPPHGAYRGFGNPQSLFAVERHLNKVAATLQISPEEFRRRNFLQDGLTTATGQIVSDRVDMNALMDRAFNEAHFHEKQHHFRATNEGQQIKRGMGFACFFHGSGFTGGGETKLASIAGVRATPEGKVEVLVASTEIGQGANTMFSQVVADALNLPYAMVEVARPDTSQVPNSGPTVASRTCMVVGKLVETAAIGLKQALVQQAKLPDPYTPEDWVAACGRYLARYPDLKVYSQYSTPPTIRWSDETYKGDAYAAYGWAVYVAEVSVDTRTYEVKVENFVALQDVGHVIHPILAAGQVEGGVAQGIGFALTEKVVYDKGRVVNCQMTNYIMPTAVDLPPIHALFHESPYSGGPRGAKGVGELPIDGPGPAIINAVEQALGVAINEIPATPEIIMKACQDARRS